MNTPVESFTYPPERYLAESQHRSRFWYMWLPILVGVFVVYLGFFHGPFYKNWMENESTGLLEFIHAFFPLVVCGIGIRLLFFPFIRRNRLLTAWMVLMAVCSFYLAGEEASWGQHYLGWVTPDDIAELNDQGETNLHNMSHWLDQKPRLILVISIIFSTLVIPWLLVNKPDLPPRIFDFVYPGLFLAPLAIAVLLTEMITQFKDVFPDHWDDLVRPGEFQELYIAWYLLAYALLLLERARKTSA